MDSLSSSTGFLGRLKSHKVIEWTLAYAALAYTVLHGVGMLSEAQSWPHLIVPRARTPGRGGASHLRGARRSEPKEPGARCAQPRWQVGISYWIPELRGFRQDARFQAFATRLGWMDYWRQSGPPDECEIKNDKLTCH